MTTSVSVKNLDLNFGTVQVLKNLSIDVEQGEFLVLLGPSGCGKSTLLNCIAGLLDVSAGQVHISGENVTWAEPKDRGIGMVFQSYALYPQMTVRGNLEFGLKNQKLPKAEIAKRVERASGILHIEELLRRKPAALSGGQRQRVAIGRALVRDVDVFLFDEPLSNLDAKLRAELRVELKRLHNQLNNTMIYVTHDQVEAMTLADRIAVMKDGLIQQHGTPAEIYNHPVNKYVADFLGSPSMNLFEGNVVGNTFTAGDMQVDLQRYGFADGGKPGGGAWLGVRPEHVIIGADAPFTTDIEIELVEPMGADTLIWCSLAGQPFRIRMDGQAKIEIGQKLKIGFDPAASSLLTKLQKNVCKKGLFVTVLNGKWDFRDPSGEYRLGITFPGDAISALHDAGAIADPYWGRNEYDLRWIAERDWFATRTFTLDNDSCELVLTGLDTVVDVSVNGQLVLRAQNAFRTYRVDLGGVAKPGENEIELHFRSSVTEAAARQNAQPFHIPYSTDNSPIANGNMLRKPQCDFGWDWNIALAPFGVQGDICIEPKTDIRIDGILVDQQHQGNSVDVTIDVLLAASGTGTHDYRIELCGQTASGKKFTAGANDRLSVRFTIENPRLWWPAGSGEQVLHDLVVTVGSAKKTRRIGLRDIALIVADDDAGTGFNFRVNGRDIFAKGANWIPADALFGGITKTAVRDLLQSAVDANMNMLRIWGGGRYEPTWFYDMCDEMGLMIWQDFMFACSLYPASDEFLAEVTAEVHHNVTRLNHHACLALWCGDNELIGALNWFEISRNNRDRYLVMYDRLNRTVEAALKDITPNANWWASSPSPGYMNFGDAWHDDSSGDMHFWSVWHEGRDFDHYRDVNPRFCSEFGFQSYPSMNVIRTFADKVDMNIAAPVLESHQKNKGGNARIAETMFRYFRFPVDFENFVYLSQVQQGLAIKTAVSYWRSLKPHCMGTLIWQLNDTWPVASWSSLDYGGGWKLLHHMAREFYQPVVVTVVPDGDTLVLKATNDLMVDTEISVEIFATNMAGNARLLGTHTTTVPPNASVEVGRQNADVLKTDEILTFSWANAVGNPASDHYAPKPYKTYDLQNPRLHHEINQSKTGYEITISAQALALFVAVESDAPGRFSHNAVTILPGQDLKITFTPQDADIKPDFILRDLYSATYGN